MSLQEFERRGMNLMHVLNDKEIELLSNSLNDIGNNYEKLDKIIPIKIKNMTYRHALCDIVIHHNNMKAFNNIRLVVKLADPSKPVEIHRLLKFVSFKMGATIIDNFSGHAMGLLLNLIGSKYVQTADEVTIPLPFGITTCSAIMDKLSSSNSKIVIIEFGDQEVTCAHLLITYYTYDKLICADESIKKYYPPNAQYLQLYKLTQINTILFKLENQTHRITINFNFPTTDLFFYFIDEFNEIIQDDLFESYSLTLNSNKACEETHTSSVDRSQFIGIKGTHNIQMCYLIALGLEPVKHTNFSLIDSVKLNINFKQSTLDKYKNLKIEVFAQSYNFNVIDVKNMCRVMYTN